MNTPPNKPDHTQVSCPSCGARFRLRGVLRIFECVKCHSKVDPSQNNAPSIRPEPPAEVRPTSTAHRHVKAVRSTTIGDSKPVELKVPSTLDGPIALDTKVPKERLNDASNKASLIKDWYCACGGKRVGPFSDVELQSLIATNNVLPSDMVWKEGMKSWIFVEQLQSFLHAKTSTTAKAIQPAQASTSTPEGTPRDSSFQEIVAPRNEIFISKLMVKLRDEQVKKFILYGLSAVLSLLVVLVAIFWNAQIERGKASPVVKTDAVITVVPESHLVEEKITDKITPQMSPMLPSAQAVTLRTQPLGESDTRLDFKTKPSLLDLRNSNALTINSRNFSMYRLIHPRSRTELEAAYGVLCSELAEVMRADKSLTAPFELDKKRELVHRLASQVVKSEFETTAEFQKRQQPLLDAIGELAILEKSAIRATIPIRVSVITESVVYDADNREMRCVVSPVHDKQSIVFQARDNDKKLSVHATVTWDRGTFGTVHFQNVPTTAVAKQLKECLTVDRRDDSKISEGGSEITDGLIINGRANISRLLRIGKTTFEMLPGAFYPPIYVKTEPEEHWYSIDLRGPISFSVPKVAEDLNALGIRVVCPERGSEDEFRRRLSAQLQEERKLDEAIAELKDYVQQEAWKKEKIENERRYLDFRHSIEQLNRNR